MEAPPTPPRRRVWLFRSALVVLWLSLIPALEVGARLIGCCETWTEANGEPYQSPYEWRNRTPWRHRFTPNSVVEMHQPEFRFDVRINSLGVRDVEHPVDKPPEEYRIVALGDSFTYGQGAAFEDTYTSQLQRILNEGGRAKTIRVLSAGVPGSDPVFCYEMLRRDLLPYGPDAVVLLLNTSDLDDLISRGGFDRFDEDGMMKGVPAPRIEWLYRRSHLARFVMQNVFRYGFMILTPGQRRVREQQALETLHEAARRFDELGRQHGFRVLVAIHPGAQEIHEEDPDYLLLARVAEGIPPGVGFLDLRPYLQRRVPPEGLDEYFWRRDGHCTPAGYRLFAEAIADALASLPGFPERR